MRQTQRCRHGVTLIEISLSLVLVSTVLLVSLTASANLMRSNTIARHAVDGASLRGQMLDEITSRHFQDPQSADFGLEADESSTDRRTFDDVDDYHRYSATRVTHRDGSEIAGFEGWTLDVEVTPAIVDASGITTTSDASDPLRWITVISTSPQGTREQTAGLVSNTPSDLGESTSYELWRRLRLQFDGRELTVSVPLRNLPDAD